MRRIADGMRKSNVIVIALGGSLIVPHLSDEGGIDVQYLRNFRRFILREVKKGKTFIIVAGGGKVCRVYQKASSEIANADNKELDWLGVESTKLNASLLLSIFRKEAYGDVINNDSTKRDLDRAKKSKKSLFIASGGKPGASTDYGAVRLAEIFKGNNVIIAGDIPYVYEKDPRKFPKAKALPKLVWKEYEKLIPKKWTPGFSSPVDPIATQLAKKLKLQVKVIKGTDFANFKNAIDGKKFKGTLIS